MIILLNQLVDKHNVQFFYLWTFYVAIKTYRQVIIYDSLELSAIKTIIACFESKIKTHFT